jgi:hypothetical protein
MPSKNPLDILFKDLKRDLEIDARKAAEARTKGSILSTYANPQNWRLGKVVRLIHATEGPIGDFQEYFHNLSPTARRLLPGVPGLQVDREELVFGDFWLHPKFSAQPVAQDSEAEIQAIEKRFRELMADFEDLE